MIRKQFRIAALISRHLSGRLSPGEETELKEWKEQSPEHARLFGKICTAGNLAAYRRTAQLFDKSKAWEQLNRKIRASGRRSLFFRFSRYAALLLIPLTAGIILLHRPSSPDKADVTAVTGNRTETEAIRPGEKKAILTLGNGETVDLKAIPEKTLEEEDGTAILVQTDALNYQAAAQTASTLREEEIYNKVDVPPGGEYALTLSDGTKVLLNAMSSLKFPVRFVNAQRVVELQGEAYFTVAKSDRPFIVKAKDLDVEVLGTVFNLSAYEGDRRHATLVEGSVKVRTANGAGRILKPSEQASIDEGSDQLSVRRVDVTEYTSWINGKISFKDRRLEDILKNLSRWYDIEVEYGDPELKNLRFGCHVNRYREITPFLELLEKTGKVTVAVHDHKITFNPNNN
jgi:ferric-dicitrate binding protein FerR (iron transport regulator)